MKLALWTIGKAHEPYVKAGIDDFTKRLNHYFTAEWNIIPVPKGAGTLSETELKRREGELILSALKPDDYLVALDERGKGLSSEGLAALVQQRANEGTRTVVFLIGGAFGIDAAVLRRAQFQWSLSALTFPHQLVRLVLAEQLYRAGTIIRNEKYHHK
ncbi:MAG: 23S rRNA (pseudouridine(1915)-N(3))-methyltransferase RlmH [Chitinophagaceae bacterium]|nr:MAG: 23S rRNA (pseudouridine(1915)-N(3))-methyltransferase RlmH [Chitinophagaceae bacterium]